MTQKKKAGDLTTRGAGNRLFPPDLLKEAKREVAEKPAKKKPAKKKSATKTEGK